MNPLPLRQIPVVNLVYAARRVVNPKLTYEYLAKKCGVSRPLVSMWFSGARDPNEKQAKVLAREMCCELDLIWAKAGTMEEAMEMALESSDEAIGRSSDTAEAVTPVTEPVLRAVSDRPDRVSMLDRKLLRHLIRSVEKSDENTEALPVYKVAASRPDEDTPREPEPAFIPRDIRKLLGKGGIALRICGESMLDAGIEPGDIVFAKRPASRPADRSIVVALLHGATTCKRLVGNELIAESPVHEDHAPIEDDAIVGVVQAIYKPDRSST